MRWYSDSGDGHVIYDLAGPLTRDDDGDVIDDLLARTVPRPCRYRCDRVVVDGDGGRHAFDADATDVTGNDRGALLDGPRLGTPTTPARASGSPATQWQPAALGDRLAALRDHAGTRTIDLMWRDRLVHRSERGGRDGRWLECALDHWDNCADEAYLRDTTRDR